LAWLGNAVTGILHLHQVPNIAVQLRACHRDPYQLPLLLLGLMTPLAPNGKDHEQAQAIYHDLGDRGGEAMALNETGTLYRLRGEPASAQAHHQQALDLARAIGTAWDEAHALAGLGRCAIAAADPATARARLAQAAAIFQRIGAPEATAVTAKLTALTTAGPATQKPRTT
jgi:hypothetical protein